jgi:hypothetical protein
MLLYFIVTVIATDYQKGQSNDDRHRILEPGAGSQDPRCE